MFFLRDGLTLTPFGLNFFQATGYSNFPTKMTGLKQIDYVFCSRGAVNKPTAKERVQPE